jgi:DNA invertase Pin-like site-specific DNA recombinase
MYLAVRQRGHFSAAANPERGSMVNALVVRRTTQLARSEKALRAAQYVRMSTELQRYSTQNQAAAIAAYAQQRNLTIVRTYVDPGRSGVRINRRPGLIELINDVQSGNADFDHILVYDVSRWGRFQDVDESAHYEFVCKRKGVKVAYCAEQFENDDSLLSSIMKNVKRVMAAEFSRELGVKVHGGLCRTASFGYRAGGSLTFGLGRELIDGTTQRSKGRLVKGEYKALKTDRVRLQLGSDEEKAVVRWIFQQFVLERKTDVAIARQLNRANIPNHHGRPWSYLMVHYILKNENYIGNLVYNRTSRRLGQKQVSNPHHLWIRTSSVVDPVVDPDLFARAQKIMAERYISIPEDQMLRRLRLLLARKGKLSTSIINDAPGLPSPACYVKHFGSMRGAYELIGYESSRDCRWIDARDHRADILSKLASQVAEALSTDLGIRLKLSDDGTALANGTGKLISFQVVRKLAKRTPNHVARWRAHLKKERSKLCVFLRLKDDNETVQDYALLATADAATPYLTLSDGLLAQRRGIRSDTVSELIRHIELRFTSASRAEPTKPERKNRRRKLLPRKSRSGRAQHSRSANRE